MFLPYLPVTSLQSKLGKSGYQIINYEKKNYMSFQALKIIIVEKNL